MTTRSPALDVLGEPGWRLLLDASAAVDTVDTSARDGQLRAAEALAKRRPDAEPARRAAALELVTSGRRLAAKLGIDEQLLAVREAVEQATPGRVATWHAQQIPAGGKVLEIGSGCGGDSLALAHRAQNLIAADLDPVRAACTHSNLMAMGLGNARAIPGDGLAMLDDEASRADVIFVDPDRRPGGRRRVDPEEWEPPLSKLLALAGGERQVFVKAAPSLDAEAVAGRFSVTYVSHRGECLEAFLRSPPGDGPAISAVLLPDDGPAVPLEGSRAQAPEGPVGEALYVPDPAAMRARLLDELCKRHGLTLVDERVALLTGARLEASPWLKRYRVLETLPLRPKDVGNVLRRLRARSVTAHSRAVDLTAPELQKRWRKAVDKKADGPEVDVFATREQDRPVAIVCERDPSRP